MAKWVYRGDINIKYGGVFILDEGDEDFVSIVEVTPCSDAGGPNNLFWITKGSLYMPTDENRRKAALETVGWYDEDGTEEHKRMCLIDGFLAYHGIDRDTEVVVQVGKRDPFFDYDHGGFSMPEVDYQLHGNVNLRKWVEREFC
jgi:hypothetical protein